MKKSKIFMVAGAAVLAISAVFASKANKKFTAFTTAYIKGSGTSDIAVFNGLFTLSAPLNWATVAVSLYTKSGGVQLEAATRIITIVNSTSSKVYMAE